MRISIKYTTVYLIDIQFNPKDLKMAKSAPINMRVEPEQQALLTKAASLLNMDRTAFILNVACREAENVLLDRRLFQLDQDAFAAFETALDKPMPDNIKIKKLLSETSPWE